MAFVVEDGTGAQDANAYITVAYADTYHADRGITAWTGSDTVKEQAIIRATDFIETRWGWAFRGTVENLDPRQGLSWPRGHVRDRDGILLTGVPEALRRATAEYALRALTTTLMPDPVVNASLGIVTAQREKVGPIETETTYSETARETVLRAYPAADRLIAPLLVGMGRGRVYR